MIEVVSGIIVRDGRILLAQRPADKDFPFTWECPGGKVEIDETHHRALDRELGEELGIELVAPPPHKPVWSGKFDSDMLRRPDRAEVFLLFYLVGNYFRGTPKNREGQGLGWFTEPEMAALREQAALAPGNTRAYWDVVRAAFPRASQKGAATTR